MTSRTTPPTVDPQDLVDAANRIAALSQRTGGLNTELVLGLADVHVLGAANVTAQLATPIANRLNPDMRPEDVLGLGFGIGIAIGAMAARMADAKAEEAGS